MNQSIKECLGILMDSKKRGTAMPYHMKPGLLISLTLFAVAVSLPLARAQDLSAPVCRIAVYEEFSELEDARITVDLAKSDFAAYERIFEMIKGLWQTETIPKMDYLKAKYDRDSAKLKLERADLVLERQAALVEEYRLICGIAASGNGKQDRAGEIRKVYLQYRRADCGSLAKSIEIAATNLEYNREYMKKILDLRKEKFASNTQVVLAELDVEREEKSIADAKRRVAACRDDLAGIERDAGK
jgi:hypothetical protein